MIPSWRERLAVLLRLLEESHARAMRSLDEAERELAVTRAYFDAKRKRAVDGHRR
jgi:hypothetical protein